MAELGKRTLVIDLDGVLATGTKETVYSEQAGWAYENCVPVEGALDFLRQMHKEYRIVVSTARLLIDKEKTQKWLQENGFMPYIDELQVGIKEPAFAYIDDRAIEFHGDWNEVAEKVKERAR